MKVLIALFAFLGAVTPAPTFNNNAVSPAMRNILIDMLKNMMNQGGFNFGGVKPPPPPPMPFKPLPTTGPAFLPPTPPQPPRGPPPRNPGGAGGVFMDIPNRGRGGRGVYRPHRQFKYCPPGSHGSDHCKDQVLQEALYHADGTPRYNWVPPQNPWDPSIPDNVKDTAQDILIMKVNSRANRTPTAKEWELMTILGDPKDGVHPNNPFAMAG
ncbi:hypothetical protein RRG08_009551 [Elysia crispata]|uniref:Uncharacterized protein n=1 Tax=Elysia crispata TaxID=231223 RepID=A0AAE0ZHC0_9GAST|nr:hypothetical protein RRG08_009551 [Elysia crispata]